MGTDTVMTIKIGTINWNKIAIECWQPDIKSKMNLKFILFLFPLLMLAGCGAPKVPLDLKNDSPAGKLEFTVNQGYIDTYKKIFAQARSCYWLYEGYKIFGKLSTDPFKGRVDVMPSGRIKMKRAWLSIDVVPVADDKTKVTTYYAIKTWEKSAAAVEYWAKINSSECKA
ncbi:MAG: hypothetical protein IIC58_12815 [Proteobacteria bacterium]|nr:hypothetical protein [Pseudomonadota bacterium]